MRSRAWVVTFFVSAIAAALVWALSPSITGHAEPWDATSYYYLIGLVFAGLVAGLGSPRVAWAYLAGAVSGQLLYEVLFLPSGPLVVVGIVFMCIYGLAFLAAALLGSYVRLRLSGRPHVSP
jgi:hypothetical protein